MTTIGDTVQNSEMAIDKTVQTTYGLRPDHSAGTEPKVPTARELMAGYYPCGPLYNTKAQKYTLKM